MTASAAIEARSTPPASRERLLGHPHDQALESLLDQLIEQRAATGCRTPRATVSELVFFIDEPGLLDRLLVRHIPNAHNDCAACPGPQSGRRKWPCQIRALTDLAADLSRAIARRAAG